MKTAKAGDSSPEADSISVESRSTEEDSISDKNQEFQPIGDDHTVSDKNLELSQPEEEGSFSDTNRDIQSIGDGPLSNRKNDSSLYENDIEVNNQGKDCYDCVAVMRPCMRTYPSK